MISVAAEEESAAVEPAISAAAPSAPVVAEQPKAGATPAPVKMEKPVSSTAKAKATAAASSLSHDEGLALAKKSGCLGCHKIEGKLVGPAWSDVSKRYKGDPDAKKRLVAIVKAGGKGNWTAVTGGIPMPPNSPKVSDEDIEKLVTFVLAQ